MGYITLEQIKKHCNVDLDFTDDDGYLEALAEASFEVVSKYIDCPLTQLEDENGALPKSLIHAMLLWIGQQYAVREAVSTASLSPVPTAFELLCDIWRDYTIYKDE